MSRSKEQLSSNSFKMLLTAAMILMILLGCKMRASAATTLKLDRDASYSSSQLSLYDYIYLQGHKLTVTGDFVTNAKIETGTNGELVVKGDMTTSKSVSALNGFLDIQGSYKQTAGVLSGGTNTATQIKIGKDFIFEKNGYFSLNSNKIKVYVGGNVSYTSGMNSGTNSATWAVGGNITQGKDAGAIKLGYLTLDGKKKQTLTLQSNSTLASINAKNSKVKIVGYLNGPRLDSDFAPEVDGNLKSNGLNLNTHKLTLPKGLDLTGSLSFGTNGELVVNGNMTTSGTVTCTRGILNVNGSYKQTAGSFYSSDACVITIKNNMSFENNAYINLTGGTAKVSVGGNVVYKSEKNCSANYAEWTVAGNITQTKESGTYRAGKLILNGTNLQTLTFRENSSVPSINAQNSQIKLAGYLNDTTLQSDFSPMMDGDLTTKRLELNQHTMELPNGLITKGAVTLGLNGKLIVNGDVTANAGMYCTKGTLEVNGNYTQTAGKLYVDSNTPGTNGTRMKFAKDVTFKENGLIYVNLTNVLVDIDGSLYYKSNAKSNLGNGEWTIAKDLIQDSGAANLTLRKVILPNKGSKVTISNGTITQLVLYYPKDKYTISLPDNKTTISIRCTMKFNVNGGMGKYDNVIVYSGEKYQALPTPTKAGYTFDGWYTKAEGGTKISKGDVINATKDFTVYAHWKKSAKYKEVTDVFSDVNKGDWFVKAVQFVYDEQIMNGTSATTFTPNGNLTRGQFVTVLYNLAGKPTVKFKNEFSDVKENDYFASAVMWAYKNGITSGVGGGAFGPNLTITREQMAVMLYKYSNLIGYNTKIDKKVLDKYPDKKLVDSWALEGMQWAVTNKVINGKSTGTGSVLDPLGKASRAECAQVILNFNDNVVKK